MLEFKALGFTVLKFYNLSVYWHPLSSRIVGHLLKLPLGGIGALALRDDDSDAFHEWLADSAGG